MFALFSIVSILTSPLAIHIFQRNVLKANSKGEEAFDTRLLKQKKQKFILTLPFFLMTVCKRTEVADIIFVVHGSRDITDLQFEGIQRLMEVIVNDSVVGKDNAQFGAVIFGTLPEEKFQLNTYSTKFQLREAIKNLVPLREFTFTARALNFARERFGAAYGGRTSYLNITKIIVLITDEPTTPTDRPNLSAAVQALKQEGIQVIAVGIEDASRTELAEIVGEKGKWFFTPSYNTLDSLYENITYLICDESKPGN